MKNFIFAVVVALVLLIFCTSCAKWEVEIIDPTKPAESEAELIISEEKNEEIPHIEESEETAETYKAEKVEKYEAENFFYSEEGYEYMAFFAGWFGAKDFKETEGFINSANLKYFMSEFYEILGEESLTEDGVFLQIPEELAGKYMLKYYGTDYKPQESDSSYNQKTNCYEIATFGSGIPNELLSYDHPLNIEENRFSVNILILEYQDELGKHFACSEMVFDVMEDEDGKFLRLVSNKVTDRFTKADFEHQAQSLTRHFLEVMNKKNIEGESLEISNKLAGSFSMYAAIYANSGKGFDKESPYVGSFGKRSKYTFYLPVDEMERIAFEVFGIEDFQYGFDSNFEYDSEKEEYLTGFEWGIGSGNRAKDMVTTVSENVYSVEFTLLYIGSNSEGDPELMEGDRYIMKFELIDGEFLRYVGFEKA